MMTPIVLATEDELSEAVARKLAAEAGLQVGRPLRKSGFGYLKSRMPNFCEMAKLQPVFLLTDLDAARCAPMLIAEWLARRARPSQLLFRIAVREVESWLLADHEGMKKLLGSRIALDSHPDQLSDPKRELLRLAKRHAPKDVRSDLVAKEGALAIQGLGYNNRLVPWVRDVWTPEDAAVRSPSLAKTRVRLGELATILRS